MATNGGAGTLSIEAGPISSEQVPLGFYTLSQATITAAVTAEGNRIQAGLGIGGFNLNVTRDSVNGWLPGFSYTRKK